MLSEDQVQRKYDEIKNNMSYEASHAVYLIGKFDRAHSKSNANITDDSLFGARNLACHEAEDYCRANRQIRNDLETARKKAKAILNENKPVYREPTVRYTPKTSARKKLEKQKQTFLTIAVIFLLLSFALQIAPIIISVKSDNGLNYELGAILRFVQASCFTVALAFGVVFFIKRSELENIASKDVDPKTKAWADFKSAEQTYKDRFFDLVCLERHCSMAIDVLNGRSLDSLIR